MLPLALLIGSDPWIVFLHLLGSCVICGDVPEKLIIEKHDGVNVISRYCNKCYIERYQKYK